MGSTARLCSGSFALGWGSDWDDIHGEAVSRLDTPELIIWLVALRKDDGQGIVRVQLGVVLGEPFPFAFVPMPSHQGVAVVRWTLVTIPPPGLIAIEGGKLTAFKTVRTRSRWE